MSMKGPNAIDYFATLGRPEDSQFLAKNFHSASDADEVRGSSASSIWQAAITDVTIINSDTEVKENGLLPEQERWTVLSTSLGDNPLPFPHIAIKRRKQTHRLDHICDLHVFPQGESLPPGFELLQAGNSGVFNGGTLAAFGNVAFKRAPLATEQYARGSESIDDIALINLTVGDSIDDIPLGFKVVQSSCKSLEGGKTEVLKYSIAFNSRPAVGLCNLRFVSTTLDRYPQKNYRDFDLPDKELPIFVFPEDLSISCELKGEGFPLPLFFSFVFTNDKGEHLYVACLQFYEKLLKAELEPLCREVYERAEEENHEEELYKALGEVVHAPPSRYGFPRKWEKLAVIVFLKSLPARVCILSIFML